ncbi:MFS transporter, DHA3 family, multidrug efflux protein [Friedmanniella luteola]|uniref:MFS transporter, DHA3 family, multidrug efflux protein n=1 Tax=Friedmanniella luteola TaxID=546871 RepID=A0A1H1ZSD9_9ACTN|nr:MFS transporter [Friedmanniella luteola]SDT36705.1 MFS transporter, DHA3 family, multidrug efflux protein [Friedmanniella luteola]
MAEVDPPAAAPRLDLRAGPQRTFLHVLLNTLVVSVTNFTLWFAVTFWAFLETRSVFVTGMIAGIFLVFTTLTGIWLGSLVDHHPKKTVMQTSAALSLGLYAVSLAVYLLSAPEDFTRVDSLRLWVFVGLLMLGVIAGNVRTIALSTLVTLLIPAEVRDRANGLVGTTTGVSFLVTSVISGLLVAAGGMLYALLLALVVLAASLVHLARVRIPGNRPGALEPSPPGATGTGGALDPPGDLDPAAAPDPAVGPAAAADRRIDLRGTLRLVRGVPGLLALIGFSCFNNFLGGVFMALLDPYGLSLVSVQLWGLLWGALSTGIIVGGLLVAKVGLGPNPVRTLLMVNLVLWAVTCLFPLRSSMVVLAVGMYAYMLIVPFAEAAEQTVLQRVVPYERQGRVFGFAQSVEQAASPLTAFLIGPLTQFVFIPAMTDGAAADLIGPWFGTGAARGMALVFVLTGVVGLLATSLALASRPYRRLSAAVAEATPPEPERVGAASSAP